MSKHARERNCNSTFLNNKFSTFSRYFKLFHFAFKHLLKEDKVSKNYRFQIHYFTIYYSKRHILI